METKKITLRSQTVKCPHCGEYYSVTYKYCPFCDAGPPRGRAPVGREKEEKAGLFSPTSFGGGHEEEKPAKSAKRPAKAKEDASASRRSSRRRLVLPEDLGEGPDLLAATPAPGRRWPCGTSATPEPLTPRAWRSPWRRSSPRPHRERSGQPAHGSKAAHSGKNGKRKKPALEPEQPELTTPHRRRKKTSEMTEAEKAVDLLPSGRPRRPPRKRERDPESPRGRRPPRPANQAAKPRKQRRSPPRQRSLFRRSRSAPRRLRRKQPSLRPPRRRPSLRPR